MFTALDTTGNRAWFRSLWAIASVVILLSGCRTAQDNQIEILERELRTQEDYIYELEDYVIQYSEKLRTMRCAQTISIESDSVSRESIVEKPKSDRSEPRDDNRRKTSSRVDEDPTEDLPNPKTPVEQPQEEFNIEDYEPPPLEIEQPLGEVQISTTEGLASIEEQPSALPPVAREPSIPSPVDYAPSPVDYAETEPKPEPQKVATIERVVYHEDLFEDQDLSPAEFEAAVDELGSSATGPTPTRIVVKQLFRDDEQGVPQKLLAVVEGRNEGNQPIEFTGEVSLMVMAVDAKRPLRLKRWDFFPKEVTAAWQSSHLGEGLHLELPLEDTELPNVPLELWVRLIDKKRNKLLTQKTFSESQLAGLEVETGAKELQSDSSPQLARGNPLRETSRQPSRSEVAGWRSSTQSTVTDSKNFASSLRKAGGWTAQSSGGHYPHSERATTEKSGADPVWTAGRVRTDSTKLK